MRNEKNHQERSDRLDNLSFNNIVYFRSDIFHMNEPGNNPDKQIMKI